MAVATAHLGEFMHLIHRVDHRVPEYLAEIEIRAAAAEFCGRAPVWRHISEFAITTDDQAIPMPTFTPALTSVRASITSIIKARWGSDLRELAPVTFDSDEAATPANGMEPSYFYQVTDDHISVAPFKTGTIRLHLTLKPSLGFDPMTMVASEADADLKYLPEFLLTHHADTIANGALARILTTVETEYSNPQAAAIYMAKFEAAINAASGKSLSGQQRAPLRVPTSWF